MFNLIIRYNLYCPIALINIITRGRVLWPVLTRIYLTCNYPMSVPDWKTWYTVEMCIEVEYLPLLSVLSTVFAPWLKKNKKKSLQNCLLSSNLITFLFSPNIIVKFTVSTKQDKRVLTSFTGRPLGATLCGGIHWI